MAELFVSLALLGLLVGGAALLVHTPLALLATLGVGLVAGGLLFGVPAGVVYHVALARALAGRLPARWWLSPTGLHPHLDAEGRRRVMPWFALGALGTGLALLGCLCVAVAAWRSGA
jgi:hypothetical protein